MVHILSFFTVRWVVVSYGSCLSNKQDILTGVPQGSILGPLLFNLFFNDKTDVIEVAKIVKYAGDTVIYVADKNVPVINIKLTKDMNAIAKWLDQNARIINPKKGKLSRFTEHHRESPSKMRHSVSYTKAIRH